MNKHASFIFLLLYLVCFLPLEFPFEGYVTTILICKCLVGNEKMSFEDLFIALSFGHVVITFIADYSQV